MAVLLSMLRTMRIVRKMDIAYRLDLAMRVAGIKTQAQLARLSGVPESTIARILKNTGQPSIENLVALASALNRSLDWIVNGTDSKTAPLPELIDIHVTHEELLIIQQHRAATAMGRSIIRAAATSAEKKKLEPPSELDN
ncbi:XRE family transcriptional regulator [Candidatus Dojkabacteria bacterium]|uniref:XRE family transcriptional regulator n=1 Tax=Candidatus Dojkabacteria bacterium TaxID=2099670 RepID=A0A5C7JEM9_9BACT|nr:MAG: XRE family transcriptional regulator [Candidatus Dojkabacteria bacterium]